MRLGQVLASFLVALAVGPAGAAPVPVDWWSTHALATVFRDTPAPLGPAAPVRLSVPRGETLGAQVVLVPRVAGVRLLGVRFEPLLQVGGRGRLEPGGCACAYEVYRTLASNGRYLPPEERLRTAPADFPDQLAETPPAAPLRPGENQPVWVQVAVPPGLPAGEYRGRLQVDTSAGPVPVPLEVQVPAVDFPARTRLKITNEIQKSGIEWQYKAWAGQERFWQILGKIAVLVARHHQNGIFVPVDLVQARRGADGTLSWDFSLFDRWVETFLAQGLERIEVSHLMAREVDQWDCKTFVPKQLTLAPSPGPGPAPGPASVPVDQLLPVLAAHLKARGWDRITQLHVGDEPIPANLDSWHQQAARVRQLAPGLRRMDAIQAPVAPGDLEVMVPILDYLDKNRARFDQLIDQGQEVWFYTAWLPQGRYPNRLVDMPLLKTRILHWLNYATRTRGYLHWGLNYWRGLYDKQAPGDNWIIWPEADSVTSSLRFEAMREGIEDYELLCMLEDAARARGGQGFDARGWVMDRFVKPVVQGIQDYTRDPDALLAARDRVVAALEAAGKGTLKLR